jgi:F-type H+-transporting ATPase subunit b
MLDPSEYLRMTPAVSELQNGNRLNSSISVAPVNAGAALSALGKEMNMLKRTLMVLIATLALVAGRAVAAEGPSHTAETAAKGAEHGGVSSGEAHGGHIEGDERLVPIPPTRDTYVSAVWVIIIFLVMLAILYKTAWKQVLAGLKARESRIRQDIAEAEASRTKAEATLREYNAQLAAAEAKARDILAKSTIDAEKLATTIRMQAQNEAEQIKERTTREIEVAAKQAKADFREYAATVATNAAEQILRRNLNEQDQRDLVNRSLDQLENVNA